MASDVLTDCLELKIISFNVSSCSPICDREVSWSTLQASIISLIGQHSPDVIGLQEALRSQVDSLVTSLGDTYECFFPEQQYSKECLAIFYLRSRFTPSSPGLFWLSEQPSVEPILSSLKNRGWDSVIVRYCSHLQLSTSTSQVFTIFNAHFDNGCEAKINSCLVVREQADQCQYAGEEGFLSPVILMCDMNSEPNSYTYHLLRRGVDEVDSDEDEDLEGGSQDEDEEDFSDSDDDEIVFRDCFSDSATRCTFRRSFKSSSDEGEVDESDNEELGEVEVEVDVDVDEEENGEEKGEEIVDYIFVSPERGVDVLETCVLCLESEETGDQLSLHRPILSRIRLRFLEI